MLRESCFAADGRLVARSQTLRGRAAVALAMDELFADARGLKTRLTSVVEAAGNVFRFRAALEFPDGTRLFELVDVREVNADRRIAQLFTFIEPLRDADPAP